jgi:hypothetical protein
MLILKGKFAVRKNEAYAHFAANAPCCPPKAACRPAGGQRSGPQRRRSCEQFLWINLLARARARLHVFDFSQQFFGDEKYGKLFRFFAALKNPGFSTEFVDKIVCKGLRSIPRP